MRTLSASIPDNNGTVVEKRAFKINGVGSNIVIPHADVPQGVTLDIRTKENAYTIEVLMTDACEQSVEEVRTRVVSVLADAGLQSIVSLEPYTLRYQLHGRPYPHSQLTGDVA